MVENASSTFVNARLLGSFNVMNKKIRLKKISSKASIALSTPLSRSVL